jgi:ribonuclease T2
VDELDKLFAATNPGLDPDAMAVMCRGPKVAEVRICMDKDLKFRACGRDVKDRCAGGKATFLSVK